MSQDDAPVPPDLLTRNPLITPRAARLLHDLKEHPDAPRWNYTCGDRIGPAELAALQRFREEQFGARPARLPGSPPANVLQRLSAAIPRSEWLRSRIPADCDLERDWDQLPCMTRADLADDLGYVIPDDCDVREAWVYATSGTTGHSVNTPNSAFGASCYAPLLEWAMERHGVRVEFAEDRVSCFLVCAQAFTITYATVHAVWGNSGFAKVNLNPAEWPGPVSAARFFETFQPPILTGDPLAFLEMRRMALPVRPKVLISTALALTPAVRRTLEETYRCPVIDTYSLNETGLIAYTCHEGVFHVLPHDLHVEVLDADGRAVAPGERGEIAVSGGRNPFLPLFRYRTGDWARMDFKPCACGDSMPRLLDLEGRAPILFRAADGSAVNTVDLSRVIRHFPIAQHGFVQRRDGSCELSVRPLPGPGDDFSADLAGELRALLKGRDVAVRLDATLGNTGKVIAFQSELEPESSP